MVLTRRDSSLNQARILWWSGDTPGDFHGGDWVWTPSTAGCDAFPGSSLNSVRVPVSGVNVFCGGHAALPDGRLLIAGGADSVTGFFGANQARLLRDTSDSNPRSWYDAGTMTQWRWYPTATALGDGRIVLTAGERAPHHRFFGGRRNGSIPTGGVQDSVYRFFPVTGGRWDRSVVPDPDPMNGRPRWREHHSAVEMELLEGGHVIFGGDSAGVPLGDLWYLFRNPNFGGDDYRYSWRLKDFMGAPSARSYHIAIGVPDLDTCMLVYGGRGAGGTPPADSLDVYRLDDFGGGRWFRFTPGGTVTPAARFAHTAIYDRNATNGDRMIVLGGIGADGQTPTDQTVWELRFTSINFSSGNWSALTPVVADTAGLDRRPAPRFGHAMVWDPNRHHNNRTGKDGHVGFTFGGQLGATAYSDTLWLLWLFDDGTVGWQPKLFGGPRPSARARLSMLLDPNQGAAPYPILHSRIYLFGGENGSGPADDSVYVVDPWDSSPRWSKWAGRGVALSGASVTLDRFETNARTPEVYDGTSWQALLGSSPLLQPTYPPTFVISGGSVAGDRILALAQSDSSYYLDVATSGSGTPWTQQAAVGFAPESGVLYAPNQIMAAGGRAHTGSTQIVNTTKTLDASSLGNSWQNSGTADTLIRRIYTNLVLLPNGQVVAIGGNRTQNQNNDDPVTVPQIWDPGTGNWTPPSGASALATQPTVRGYHSTAILLPDARVLSGGGDQTTDELKFNVFCPPYLFKPNSDLLATRPVITSAPDTIAWVSGPTYTIRADTTAVQAACLIRPGATTHAFDQNQRRFPLTFVKAGGPDRLLVSTPPDPASAPPGNYLLFISGSADRSDVPSLARWIKIGATALDGSDAVRPAPNSDFSAVCDPNTPNGWIVSWTETADDSGLSTSGTVIADTVRKSSDHITDSNWSGATLAYSHGGVTPGSLVSYSTAVGTTTYLRMRSVDNGNHLAALSRELVLVPWTTLNYDCPGGSGMYAGGGGGGGASLQRASGATAIEPSRQATTSTAAGSRSVENSVLDSTGLGHPGRDLLQLPATIASGGIATVRVREAGQRAAALDAARLLVVDRPSTLRSYVVGGQIVAGTPQHAPWVKAADGTDLSAVLDGSGSYAIVAGEALGAGLGPGGGASPVLLIASGVGTLQVQVPDDRGGWRLVGQATPRVDPDELVLGAPGSDSIRILTRGLATLSYVGSVSVSTALPAIQTASMVSAWSTRSGDVAEAVASVDSTSATLAGPDTLFFRYSLPAVTAEARDYFLAMDATPLDPRALPPVRLQPARAEAPVRFELEQNMPNPFSGSTSIRFALPAQAPVRLEVFDLMGRRLRTLAVGTFVAGRHAVEWDHCDASGNRVQPGVYLYRLVAGTFREQKRMVLLGN